MNISNFSCKFVAANTCMTKQRNILYDISKGLGILLVIWGHTTTPFFYEIYAFHMPFFFMVSGVFYKSSSTFKEQLKKNTKRLIYPYLLFSIVIYLFYLVFSLVFKLDFDYGSIVKIIPYKDLINTPLWFLISLFIVSTLYFYFSMIKNKWLLGIICFSFFVLCSYGLIPEAFHLHSSFNYLVFFFIGNCFVQSYDENILKRKNRPFRVLIWIVSFILFVFLFYCKNSIDIKIIKILISFLTAVAGSFMLLNLSSLLTHAHQLTKGLAYIGKNSLPIFAMQLPLMELTRPLSSLLFERETYIWGISNVIINLVITIIVAEILYRMFPKILKR